jgi:flagellar L-ring protein FlgH
MNGNGLIAMAVLIAATTACSPALPPPPPWAPTPMSARIPPGPATEGSLWRGTAPMADLYSDLRARRVGDVVTIKIVENAEALKSASTKTSRESGISGSVTSFFGAPLNFHGFKPEVAGSMKNDFEGSGTTQRKDTLVATMTAKVVDVLPYGMLRVEGYREVIINNERQYIILRGVVRPEDISSDNSVLSSAIADAQIAYSGQGVVSDKQKPGWIGRILDHVWPF